MPLDPISEAIAIATTRTFVSNAQELIALGVQQETVACALLAAAVEQWGEAHGADTVPSWLLDAAGLRSIVEPAATETGGVH